MKEQIVKQLNVFEKQYDESNVEKFSFHDSVDPLIRLLRDRRLRIALDHYLRVSQVSPADNNVLVVCGGVGGEGTFLANVGFRSVTVSDFSENALKICEKRDRRLATLLLDAENLELPDQSYDLVLVQDGLHHLQRPVSGFTEMLRVARKGVIVIEPHLGLVATVLGTVWEAHDGIVNYVFRWNRHMLEEISYSFFLRRPLYLKHMRLWNHDIVMGDFGRLFGGGKTGLLLVRFSYWILDIFFGWLGNMFIGIIVKDPPPGYASTKNTSPTPGT
jgi:ubiquinone/menaquinone biosynthesis C-methylase UbiE